MGFKFNPQQVPYQNLIFSFGMTCGIYVAREHFLTSGVRMLERVARCLVQKHPMLYGTSVVVRHDCRLFGGV